MTRIAISSLAHVVAVLFFSQAGMPSSFAEPMTMDRALSLSQQTGRPIFAVAGNET